MVLNSAFSACRESRRVCWTTIGTSLVMTLENGVSGAMGSGIFEIVEAQMTASAGRDLEPIRTDRIPVFVKEEYFDMRGSSPALRMQMASWLVICGEGPWL